VKPQDILKNTMHRFGTMGWNYEDWRGEFYTPDTPKAQMLAEFSQTLQLVELDSTFYAVPKAETLEKWASQTPDGFLFTAKLPKLLSHERRLVGSFAEANDFAMLLKNTLGAKCGGVLLQLPPDFALSEQNNLMRFLEKWEQKTLLFIEFRHPSCHKIIANLPHDNESAIRLVTTERFDTGGIIFYLRLLGEENAFAKFTHRQQKREQELDRWAERLKDGPDALVFVRNFYEGHAPATLSALSARLGYSVPTPAGQQQMRLF
jgi:uncharacterized protein YecE (DUF72 family)